MLVSAGAIRHHGKTLGAGEPIPNPKQWGSNLTVHLKAGSILDVTEEQAAKLREGQAEKDARAKAQRARKIHRRAKAKAIVAAALVQSLTDQLTKAEQAWADAEQAEFAAADALAALGPEPEPVAVEEPQPEPEPEPAPEPEPTAQQLRSKTVGVLGGYTRQQLLHGFGDPEKRQPGFPALAEPGFEVDLRELLPKGRTQKKTEVLAAAVAYYEARGIPDFEERKAKAKQDAHAALGVEVEMEEPDEDPEADTAES